jgi:DNA-binding LacI/PurR family transcriptional regulator
MAESTINALIALIEEKQTLPLQKIFDCKLVIRESAKQLT